MNVSVVITTHNRSRQLHRSLWSILTYASRKPQEIIVVDDMSSDNTAETVRGYADLFPEVQISYIPYHRDPVGWTNPAIPRNMGIRFTNPDNELIVFSEPEMLWTQDVLKIFCEWFENPPTHLPKDPFKDWIPPEVIHPHFFLTASHIAYCADDVPLGNNDGRDPMSVFGHHAADRRWPESNTRVAAVLRKDVFAVRGWDERFRGWGYDDSVTGDVPITIRKNGIVDIIPISDFFPEYGIRSGNTRVPVAQTQIWSRSGWSDVEYVYRHKVEKPIYKISTTQGLIKVTNDHSLFKDGVETKACEFKIGDEMDRVVLPDTRKMDTLTTESAWLFGVFAAEGNAFVGNGHYNWRISNQNEALLERAKRAAQAYFCSDFKVSKFKDHDGVIGCLDPVGDKKTKAIAFREKFYTRDGHKKIPAEILNGSLEIKQAFLDGHFAGDGSLDERTQTVGYTTNSMTLARGIEQLLWELGIVVSLSTRPDKPDIILLRENKSGVSRKKGINKIEVDGEFNDYVYDVSTSDHTFVAGLGGIVAHNTDFMTRLQMIDCRHIALMIPVIHTWHEPPPADGGTAQQNLDLMQKSHREGITAPNGDDWGGKKHNPHFGTEIDHETWIQIQNDELLSWTDKAWPSRGGKLLREKKYLTQAAKDLDLDNLVDSNIDGVAVDFGCGPLSILEVVTNNLQKLAIDPLHEGYEKIRDWEHDNVQYMYGRGEDFKSNLPIRLITSVNGIDHYENPKLTLQNMVKFSEKGGFIALHYCINNASEGHPHPAHRIDLDSATMLEWGKELGLEVISAKEVPYGWRHQLSSAIVFRKK